MRSFLVALLVVYFIAYGLGSYVMLARLPSFYGFARDGELILALAALLLLLYKRRQEPGSYDPKKHHWALLAYVAVLFLNCLRSEPISGHVLLGALQLSLTPFLAYAIGAILVRQPGGARTLLWALAGATVLMSIPAFIENGLGLVSMALWVDARFEDTLTRATGFLANPIILASVYQMALVWALGVLLLLKRWSSSWWAVIFLCVLLLCILYISYTRAGWLAFWFSILVFWYFHKPKRHILLGFAGLLLLIILIAPTGRVRLATMAEMRHRSNATRIDRWYRCAQYIWARPIVGHGLGRTCGVAPNQNGVKGAFYAHNYLLQLWVELGLVGLLPFVLFWFFYLRHIFRTECRTLRLAGCAALAGFAAHAMVIGHIEYPPVAMMVGMTLALLDGTLPDEPKDMKGQYSPLLLATPAIMLMIVLAALQTRVAFFQYGLQEAYQLKKSGQIRLARNKLNSLLEWNRQCLEEEHDLAKNWRDKF